MRTYESFLVEYSLSQTAGASDKLAGIANRRQAARVATGGKGSDGNSSALNSKLRQGSKEKARRIKQGANKGFTGNKAITKRPSSRAVDPAGPLTKSKPSSLSKKPRGTGGPLSTRPANKGSAIVKAKQKAKLGDEKRNVGNRTEMPRVKKPQRPPNPTRKSVGTKDPKGFMGGLKSSLGGDAFSKDKKERRAAQEKLGRGVGKAIRSAPGKALRTTGSLVKKAASGAVGNNVGIADFKNDQKSEKGASSV